MGLDHGFTDTENNDIITLRKANHIHNWMCEHTDWDDNEMNGDWHSIPITDIEKLIECMKNVLKNHSLAPKLLPRSDGFFFGSQEYDRWYFDDIRKTLEALEQYLKENPDTEEIRYWAWW